MATKQPTRPDPKDSPFYLVITPIEQLMDDGLAFEGENEKDRIVNQFDFMNHREILLRFDANLTADQKETLIRDLRLSVKMPGQ